MDAPALELPPDLRWSCLRCGRSCEDWTEVAIDAASADRLRRLPLFHARLLPLEDGTLPYGAAERAPGDLVLRHRPGAAGGSECVLLDQDRLCALHAVHGEEVKPAACRSFPFVFIETKAGARVAVSFACTAILHDQGEPLHRQRSGIAAIAGFATHREKRGVGLRLAPGDPLSWSSYELLETRLAAALAGSADVASGLLAQAALLREAAGLGPLDLRPARSLRRFAIAWLAELAGRPPRFRPPVAGLERPDAEALLRRWVAHRLWRRDLLRGGEVLFAHGLLLAEVALAREWAARIAGGMAEAVAQVERGLALHSDLVERIEADPVLRRLAGRLFLAPRFAASLAGGAQGTG